MDNVIIVLLTILVVGVFLPFFIDKRRKYVITVCRKNGKIVGYGMRFLYAIDSDSFPKELINAMKEGEKYTLACRRRNKLGGYQYYFANDNVVNFIPRQSCVEGVTGAFLLDGENLLGYMNINNIPALKLLATYKALPLIYGNYHDKYGVKLLYLGLA